MSARLRVAIILSCLLLASPGLSSVAQRQAPAPRQRVGFLSDGSAGAAASLKACRQAVDTLADRGWELGPALVRIQIEPNDATRLPATLALRATDSPEENAFLLILSLVKSALVRAGDGVPADLFAAMVAAHLSPAGTPSRDEWEETWLNRLAGGDILTTASPELLWRTGADNAIRDAAGRDRWPASALEALRRAGLDEPAKAAGEVALAGLLEPELLGFGARAVAPNAVAVSGESADVWLGRPGLRVLSLVHPSS
ncbi:MAG: hypothetical protein V1750_04455, partial [Acidobacteriota bacterium]